MTRSPSHDCVPWPQPEPCKTITCNPDQAADLYAAWWPAITEWLDAITCYKFGVCHVEVAPCAPCGCPQVCGCGPWRTIDLREAFCRPILLGDDCVPQVEFRFPDGEGGTQVLTTQDGLFSIRPNMRVVDWCKPFKTCGGFPAQDCETPWTIAATVGRPPPRLLLEGAAKFVAEIVKDCSQQESCLPDNVTSITRRGISMNIDDGGFSESSTVNFDTEATGVATLDIALRQWAGCPKTPIRIYDPITMCTTNNERKSGWSFRPIWPPTPVGEG